VGRRARDQILRLTPRQAFSRKNALVQGYPQIGVNQPLTVHYPNGVEAPLALGIDARAKGRPGAEARSGHQAGGKSLARRQAQGGEIMDEASGRQKTGGAGSLSTLTTLAGK
jgi:hypothetical protein